MQLPAHDCRCVARPTVELLRCAPRLCARPQPAPDGIPARPRHCKPLCGAACRDVEGVGGLAGTHVPTYIPTGYRYLGRQVPMMMAADSYPLTGATHINGWLCLNNKQLFLLANLCACAVEALMPRLTGTGMHGIWHAHARHMPADSGPASTHRLAQCLLPNCPTAPINASRPFRPPAPALPVGWRACACACACRPPAQPRQSCSSPNHHQPQRRRQQQQQQQRGPWGLAPPSRQQHSSSGSGHTLRAASCPGAAWRCWRPRFATCTTAPLQHTASSGPCTAGGGAHATC